jgi:circadian clock protein KaiC
MEDDARHDRSIEASPWPRVSTGIDGLDAILRGGLPAGFMYAVQGEPGVGKTTLGLHFLLDGVAHGERVLYLTLSHGATEIDVIARSHGWSVEGMPIHEFSALEASDQLAREQTVFSVDEVEAGELADSLTDAIARMRPQRVVIDAVEQLRLLSERPQRYRRQLLLLKRALADVEGCTTLFLADMPSRDGDLELAGMVHGVIQLERRASAFGSVFRRLQVTKGRGMVYADGYHTFRIVTGGAEVYPRVQDTGTSRYAEWRLAPSGIDGLDELLGGGLEYGTACLFVGSIGTGKSTLVTRYATSAAARGERVAVFLTDEREETFLHRAAMLSMDATPFVEAGTLSVRRVNLSDLPHGAFADAVRTAVESEGATVVAIDSLTGYLNAIEEEGTLTNQMHDLLNYLSSHGVLTLVVMTEAGLVGGGGAIAPIDISYLADTVILQRHFEAGGRVRRAISVIKKRHGPHENSIRELAIGEAGISISEPITSFSHVLGGSPHYLGDPAELMPSASDDAE